MDGQSYILCDRSKSCREYLPFPADANKDSGHVNIGTGTVDDDGSAKKAAGEEDPEKAELR